MSLGYDSPLLWYAVLGLAFAIAVGGVRAAGVSFRHLREPLTGRFIYGVPWGTFVVLLTVLSVYLFVQRGAWDWHRPVIVRYMAFSIFDPVGWGFAGLAHAGPDHLLGNLTSTLVFGPIVEYAWGHYPPDDHGRWAPAWLARPRIRALVAFPLGVIALGAGSGAVAWGPVIGFSFVVFALLGCSLVHFPVLTLAALIVRGGVRILQRTLSDPVTVSEATTRVVRPSWYGTAVQGHLFGLLVGVLLGVFLLRYWDRRPAPERLWISAFFLGLSLSLWALWWVLGPERFVLFRALGVGLVALVATVIVWTTLDPSVVQFPVIDRSPPTAGLTIVLVAVVAMSLVGLGINAVGVGTTQEVDGTTVDGYEVFYAENVTNEMFGVLDVEVLGLSTRVQTSGVVVQRETPQVWYRAVPAVDLKTHGRDSFRIGDLGWSERIRAARVGWEPTDNRTVYGIWLDVGDGWEHVWDAPPSRAAPIVANHTFDVVVEEGEFFVDVEHAGAVQRVAVPEENESVGVHEVQLSRSGNDLYVIQDGTEVRIATRETYE